VRNLIRLPGRAPKDGAVLQLTKADLSRPPAPPRESEDLKRLSAEIAAVANYVDRLRRDIARLKLNETLRDGLPGAKEDVARARQATEAAAGAIMTAAESLLAAPEETIDLYREEVETKLMEILEACTFQDIAGQRLGRVATTLNQMEKRLSRFASSVRIADAADVFDREAIVREARREVLLVEGPQDEGQAIEQDAIDKLFG
jgi:chemotaxis protein CheZ